jgi:hypothetical protein
MGWLKWGQFYSFIYGGYLWETGCFWRTDSYFCSWIISGGMNGLFKTGFIIGGYLRETICWGALFL